MSLTRVKGLIKNTNEIRLKSSGKFHLVVVTLTHGMIKAKSVVITILNEQPPLDSMIHTFPEKEDVVRVVATD